MNTSIPRIPPPVFFLAGIVVMVLLNSYFPIGRWLHYPWRYLGIIFLVLGFSLGLGSGLYFRRLGTNPRPGAKATLIVTTGPFKYTRNPMYLGANHNAYRYCDTFRNIFTSACNSHILYPRANTICITRREIDGTVVWPTILRI